jgi:tetratricopeptide (TPR) repeat protein
MTALLLEPHPGRTPLDGLFDANRDGRLSLDEVQRARAELFRARLVTLPHLDPGSARLADLNDDGALDDREVQQVLEWLFADPHARGAHAVTSPVDRKADANGDGKTGGDEFGAYFTRLVRAVAVPASVPAVPSAAPLVTSADKGTTPSAAATPAATTAPTGTAAATTGTTTAPQAGTNTTATTGSTTPAAQAPASTTAKAATVKLGFSATFDPVFPIFLKYYDTAPVGKATLTNAGTTTLENVKVQLIVKEYMTDRKLCGTVDSLAAGASKDVDLYALFTRGVLDISEATKAQANVSIDYTAGGQAKTEEFVETISFYNRNNMTWDDDRRVAAFVTKNDPAVMLFRAAAVSAVDAGTTAIDKNIRTAIAVHEALALHGVKYWADPKQSYETTSASKTTVDYLQFPVQTLQLKTGDCDDLSILWSALLEAASVDTAFITIPGHIYMAFALGMSAADAKKSALAQQDIVYAKDKAWIPVEVTSIKDGFLKAWQAGAKEWRDASAKGTPGFIPFGEASAKYAPVQFSAGTTTVAAPADAALSAAFKAELKKLVDTTLASQLAVLQADITKNKDKPDPLNRLGVLYARYGLTSQATAQFTAALKVSAAYVPALVNLGNLAFLDDDAKSALGWYEKALSAEPNRATVLLGIARANHELENYGKVKEAFEKLKSVDAALAAQYTYLDLQGSDATKAANLAGVSDAVEWDDK